MERLLMKRRDFIKATAAATLVPRVAFADESPNAHPLVGVQVEVERHDRVPAPVQ